jgi:type I restriction enzyme S subunit
MNNINNDNIKVPEGWKKGKVKNLFYDGRGRIISEQEIKEKEGIYPVYSSQTENMGELGRINTYDFEGEFITWTTDGANAGTVFYRKGKFNCTNVCGFLKPKSDEADVLFFSYYLSTIAKNYVSYIGNPKLMNYIFKEIPILIPPLPEQQKIAEILETVDRAIEKTDKIIEKYKRIKQGLMQDLLTRGIDENGKIRSEKTHKFKTSPIGRIPEEWEIKKLEEIGEIISGSTPNTNITEFWNGNIVWITPEDLSKADKLFLNSSIRKITLLGLKNCSAKIIPANSIVISSRAPIGYIKVITVDFSTNQGCKSISYNGKFNSVYLAYLLTTKTNEMINLGGGTTFQEITKSNLKSLLIPLPPLPEQQRIAEILSQIDNTIEKEEAYKQKLDRIKKGLMEDLLTGRVRVNKLIKEKEV